VRRVLVPPKCVSRAILARLATSILRHCPLHYVDDLGPIVVTVNPYVAARVNGDDPQPKLATLHAQDLWTQVNRGRLADRHALIVSRWRLLTHRGFDAQTTRQRDSPHADREDARSTHDMPPLASRLAFYGMRVGPIS